MTSSARLPRLHLDYQAVRRGPRLLGFALLVLTIAAVGLLLERHRSVRTEIARLEASQSLRADRPTRAPKRSDADELKDADAVLRQLALPWASIVRAVESSATADVALLQMQPDARERQVRLGAEARSEQAMLEYLRRLKGTQLLDDVHLASHQVVADDPQRPIQFTVLARLRGAE